MGILNLFKKKKSTVEQFAEVITKRIFPKGSKDIDAGTEELLKILNYSITRDIGQNIFHKSMILSAITEKFDEERLKIHLKGYCIQYFDEKQIKSFFHYLASLNFAMGVNGVSPSEVKRNGDNYTW